MIVSIEEIFLTLMFRAKAEKRGCKVPSDISSAEATVMLHRLLMEGTTAQICSVFREQFGPTFASDMKAFSNGYGKVKEALKSLEKPHDAPNIIQWPVSEDSWREPTFWRVYA